MDEWRNRGHKMVEVYLYVEGGGDARSTLDECRKGFRCFLERAGFQGKMPRIVACGGRSQTYDRFCTKVKEALKYKDCIPVMLIDSEKAVGSQYERQEMTMWRPWDFLKDSEGDQWIRPDGTENNQCHLMVRCMESWLLCDIDNLRSFYGQGFSDVNLAQESGNNIETIDKERLYSDLKKATERCSKGKYNKGNHSFKLLETTDPQKVTDRSGWALRFISDLKDIMGEAKKSNYDH